MKQKIKKGPATAVLLALLFIAFSCRKNENGVITETNLETLTVPEGFTWENSREVSFSIGISDTRFGQAIHYVSIYNGDPANGGELISGGAATLVSPFNTKLALASVITEVYIVKKAPDGSAVSEKVAVNSTDMFLTIGEKSITKAVMATSSPKGAGISATVDCNSGCTRTITSSDNNLNINDNEVVCITGSNITVGINANGGTIRICGSNVSASISLNNSAKLLIASSASVTFNNLSLNSTSAYFENSGTVTANGSFSPSGIVTNHGTLTIRGDFSLNSGATLTNNGIINITSAMNVNTSNISLNNGKIITDGDFTLNGGSRFTNNCSLRTKKKFNDNSEMKNYGLIKADDETTVNGGALVILHNGAMLKTTHLTLNGSITGSGTTSLVKIADRTVINGGASVSGSIQLCDQNGIETNYGNISGSVEQACSLYVPVTGCNSEGNGTAPGRDTDGDGVADAIDEYPDDATRAFNNYYPSGSSVTASTLAFEDKWPSKGDYDMNDIVISYRYNIVTNAANKVVEVNGTYNLIATGGTYKNGFGVEFPLNREHVSGLSGGTLEAGQAKAVVILFSDSRQEQSAWNTRPGETAAPVKTYTVKFNVTSLPLLSSFGLGSYNPFIWNNSQGRGYETHLAGKTPTDLVNSSLFGTSDDRTGSGKYYVTATGLPWAIDVPQSLFNYPVEGADISKAYLHFAGWAASSGNQYTDWFANTASGYRNSNNLYLK